MAVPSCYDRCAGIRSRCERGANALYGIARPRAHVHSRRRVDPEWDEGVVAVTWCRQVADHVCTWCRGRHRRRRARRVQPDEVNEVGNLGVSRVAGLPAAWRVVPDLAELRRSCCPCTMRVVTSQQAPGSVRGLRTTWSGTMTSGEARRGAAGRRSRQQTIVAVTPTIRDAQAEVEGVVEPPLLGLVAIEESRSNRVTAATTRPPVGGEQGEQGLGPFHGRARSARLGAGARPDPRRRRQVATPMPTAMATSPALLRAVVPVAHRRSPVSVDQEGSTLGRPPAAAGAH